MPAACQIIGRRHNGDDMDKKQVHELLLQALETERGGIEIYTTALKCALQEELYEEWEKYLAQTRRHEQMLVEVCETFGLDPETPSAGRSVVQHLGASLVKAMEMALDAGEPEAAQLVACECVVLAETKDHQNWELIGLAGAKLKGDEGKALRAACEEIEDQEDEHLYHTKGWGRELWIKSLGMRAVLPPPEEEKHVKSAIGAARAQAGRLHPRS